MFGMMVQLDGSPHDWFEGRAARCTLLVFIDDATSKLLWLEFAPSEAVESLMRATVNYLQVHGIPCRFYVDHGSVFHVNLNNEEHEKKTQWERACAQIGIEVKHAHSPQAKGRVERANGTLQDRLIKEMRLAGISSIESANQYLRTGNFITDHNARFAVKPAVSGNAHADHCAYNLDDIFSFCEERTLTNDFTLTFNKRIFQLHVQQKTIVRPKDRIMVKTSLKGVVSLWIRKTKLMFTELSQKPITFIEEKKYVDRIYKPSKNSRRWASGLLPLSSRVKPALPAVKA
jgi:hypothetical protein